MTDRTILIAENGRATSRGVRIDGPNRFVAYHRDADDLIYVLDYAAWLGSGTITSVSRGASGTVVAGTSNTTTTVTQRLKGRGYVDIAITTAAGMTRQDRIVIVPQLIEDAVDAYEAA